MIPIAIYESDPLHMCYEEIDEVDAKYRYHHLVTAEEMDKIRELYTAYKELQDMLQDIHDNRKEVEP